ncbi:MAG: hypothetical protein JWP14_2130 [Frankiales bacterium]|nr:hypothetical protein [Frankiales bacterium]
MSDESKPFDASFGSSALYRQPQGDSRTWLFVEGVVCAGEILGRNGPRVQVRFQLGDSTYVRWFDADALLDDPDA